jgi:hypothetical protein
MQNEALLARFDKGDLIPDVNSDHYRQDMEDLMAGLMLNKNLVRYEAKRTAA